MCSNLCQFPTLQVVQNNGVALAVLKQLQRAGKFQEQLIFLSFILWIGEIPSQTLFQLQGRCVQGIFQRAFAADIPFFTSVIAHLVQQRAGQDLAQPGSPLGVILTLKMVHRLVGLQQRLLDKIGRV